MKVILLDVYETLLRGRRLGDPEPALRRVAAGFGLRVAVSSVRDAFDRAVRDAHRASPEPWPEVDVREIWRGIFPELAEADAFALAMEEARHAVEPVPGAAAFLDRAAAAGIALGLVSNAQAYTRVLLDRHFGGGRFDPARSAFSYRHRLAKPDPRLFEAALAADDRRGIPRREILMIGDSPANDIAPARALGLAALRLPRGGPFPAFNEVLAPS